MKDIKIERLKQVIDEKGWTQKRIAEEVGYTQQYISNLLKGVRPIVKDCAIPLAKCLKVRAEYLLGEDDFKTESEKHLSFLTNLGNQSVTFEQLLLSLGYKITRCETEDPLNDEIIIVDTLSFEHKLTEDKFDELQKEVFEFIGFKIDRI